MASVLSPEPFRCALFYFILFFGFKGSLLSDAFVSSLCQGLEVGVIPLPLGCPRLAFLEEGCRKPAVP